MKKSCPVIGRSWNDLVSKLNGDEDLAYTLYFKYGDDAYDMSTEDLAPFTGTQAVDTFVEETELKPEVEELFDSNPELANAVYEALGFKNEKINFDFEISIDDNGIIINAFYKGENLGVIDIQKKGNEYFVRSVKSNIENQGIGTEIYKKAIEYVTQQGGVLKPDVLSAPQAYSIYKKLEKEGLFKITNVSEQLEDGRYEIEGQSTGKLSTSEITSQQKQQALQLYSQYLDTIFPDSQVKDIVYHGTKGFDSSGREKPKFDKFDKIYIGKGQGLRSDDMAKGFYFGSYKIADRVGTRIIPAILNVQEENTTTVRRNTKDFDTKGDVFVVFEPEQIHILGNQQDIEGFKEFVSIQEEPDISFKAKPLNTLSHLKQTEFKSSLRVGDEINFPYWDEKLGNIVNYRNLIVTEVQQGKFYAKLPDESIQEFDFKNILDNQIEGTLSKKEQKVFKSHLKIGEKTSIKTTEGDFEGKVLKIASNAVTLSITKDESIIIPYDKIYKEDSQIKFLQKVQEIKDSITKQITIYGGKVRTQAQKERLESLNNALSILNSAQQLSDLKEFFEEVSKNIDNTKALMTSLEDRDISPASKLYIISYSKDFIDSFEAMEDLNNMIQKYDNIKEIKNLSNSLVSKIVDARAEYYNVAIPQLADLLWEEFNPRVNEDLAKVKGDLWTKERLIQELRNPTRDIDTFNKFFVAPINSNDAITGLFAKMIKKRKEVARRQDEMLLRKLVPVVTAVKNNFNYEEVIKDFYKLETITEEVNGEKKELTVRKFVEQYNTSEYYNTLNKYYQIYDDLYAKKNFANISGKKQEAKALQLKITEAYNQRKDFQKKNGINISAVNFKAEMEEIKNYDKAKFFKYLDSYYEKIPRKKADLKTCIISVNELTNEEIYYKYKGNRWVPNKEKYETEEYKLLLKKDPLIVKLYTLLKGEYDKANRIIPIKYRLDGRVPAMYETNFLNSISKGFNNFWKSTDKQYMAKLDGKAYKEIPIGFTKTIDVSESSDDIVRSTLMFIAEANNYQAMNEYLGATDTIIEILEGQGNPLEEGQRKLIRSEYNNRLATIKQFVKQIVYGEQNAYNTALSKSIDALGKATAITRLGLNPLNWAQNFLIGNISNYKEAFGGRHFDRSHLAWANKEFMKMQVSNPKKLSNMIRSLDAIQGRFLKNFGDEILTFKEKYLSTDVLFIGQDIGEVQIQGTAMLALLKSWGVEIPEDGNFDMDKIPENFIDTLHAINKHNHGVYNNFDRLYAQDNALFRLVLQFRKFIVPTFRARYSGIFNGEYRIDFEAGTVEKGYYRLFYEYMRDSMKEFRGLPGMIAKFNDLSDIQKEGVRRSLLDLMSFTVLATIVCCLKPGDDEDEEDMSNWEWLLIYEAARLRADEANYLPVLGLKDQLKLVNNPFPAYPLIKNVLSFLGAVADFDRDDEGNVSIFKKYQRDTGMYEKGDYKIFGKMNKLQPGINPLKPFYAETMLENFEKASEN